MEQYIIKGGNPLVGKALAVMVEYQIVFNILNREHISHS